MEMVLDVVPVASNFNGGSEASTSAGPSRSQGQADRTCSACSKTFVKPSHLKRHLLTHETERSFACPACEKTFGRRDTLARHIASHSGTRRSSRACVACSRAKVRCGGEEPCKRCESKGRGSECIYSSPEGGGGGGDGTSPLQAISESGEVQGGGKEVLMQALGEVLALRGQEAPTMPLPHESLQEEQVEEAYQIPAAFPISSLFAPFGSAGAPGGGSPYDWLSGGAFMPLSSGGMMDGLTLPATPAVDMSTVGSSGDNWTSFFVEDDPFSFDVPTVSEPYYGKSQLVPTRTLPASSASHQLLANAQSRAPSPSQELWIESSTSTATTVAPRPAEFGTSTTPAVAGEPGERKVPAFDEAGLKRLRDAVERMKKNELHTSVPMELFTSVHLLDSLIRTFFAMFNDCYPIIHAPSFNSNETHWLLLLAVLGWGARGSSSTLPQAAELGRALNEVLRRGLAWEAQRDDADSSRDTVAYLQALLLYAIHGLFGGDRRQFESAEIERGQLVTRGRRAGLFKARPWVPGYAYEQPGRELDELAWKEWVAREVRLRLGHSIIQFECYCVNLYDLPSSLSLSELQGFVPSPMDMWTAPTHEAWAAALGRYNVADLYPLIFRTINDLLHEQRRPLDSLQHQSLTTILGRMLVEKQKARFTESLYTSIGQEETLSVPLETVFGMSDAEWAILHAIERTGIFERAELDPVQEGTNAHYTFLMQLVPLPLARIMAGKPTATTRQDATLTLLQWSMGEDAKLRVRQSMWHASQIFYLVSTFESESPLLLQITFDAAIVLYMTCVLYPRHFVVPEAECFALDATHSIDAARWFFAQDDVPAKIAGIGSLQGADVKSRVLRAFEQLLLRRFPGWGQSRGLARILEGLRIRESRA